MKVCNHYISFGEQLQRVTTVMWAVLLFIACNVFVQSQHCLYFSHTHTTHSEAPSAPPRSLSGVAVGSTVVTLTWSSPPLIDINGIIRNYVIRIRERETSRVWIFQTTNSHTNITSLHPYYNYECEVAAHTISTGPYTDPVSVQTMEAGNNIVQLFCS